MVGEHRSQPRGRLEFVHSLRVELLAEPGEQAMRPLGFCATQVEFRRAAENMQSGLQPLSEDHRPVVVKNASFVAIGDERRKRTVGCPMIPDKSVRRVGASMSEQIQAEKAARPDIASR